MKRLSLQMLSLVDALKAVLETPTAKSGTPRRKSVASAMPQAKP
jgi:hypothetical protein